MWTADSRGTCRVLSVAALTLFCVVALIPFQWAPPHAAQNGAQFGQDAHLYFWRPGFVRSRDVPMWLPLAIAKNHLTLHLKVATFATDQTGPARIFTVSRDHRSRNLTIGQTNADLVVRLRVAGLTDYNGLPEYRVPDVFRSNEMRAICIRLMPDRLAVEVDGNTVLAYELPAQPLRNWNPGFRLALGNEFTGDRPWRGVISEALVVVGDREVNCLESLHCPQPYLVGMQRDFLSPLSDAGSGAGIWRDLLLNVVAFIPVGWCVANSLQYRPLVGAVCICALASLSVEGVQLLFEGRVASFVDVIMNASGAALGASTATRLQRWHRTVKA